ncbi:arginine deiminase-related protein [Arenimonas sp. GDDSR-1]|uniref:arginine deiminase-related protein n=1 Tax=Arenimonas sp. GDDSR-1 TaxID=2950125 RepID=UPI00260B89D8|nr:arginine deiminase-related protein [Arenimonas sp. GDDSR-1]
MITRDPEAFFAFAAGCDPDAPACAKAVFMLSPEGFRLAEQSATDNRYMRMTAPVDAAAAHAEHRALQSAIRRCLPVICFPGDADTPDAVFPNNVFALTTERLIIGHMRHSVRQREAAREDIRRFFTETLGRTLIDLGSQPGICELTGSLVIDRARGLGYCGLSERCDEAGARAMHAAFGLRATLMFDLAEDEYHTNVVLSILAGRAAVIAPCGFHDRRVPAAIAGFYGDCAVRLSPAQKADYAGNCIALSGREVFLSARAEASLDDSQRRQLADSGFVLQAVPMPTLELAGGSLRCCVGEIY